MGGSGMLGHRMFQVLSRSFETFASVRTGAEENLSPQEFYSNFSSEKVQRGVDSREFKTVTDCLDRVRPQVIVNCIGVIKQRSEGTNPVTAIELNSLFPHRLAEVCGQRGIWLIHIGTDCVFSGMRGNYTESDPPDAMDLYGRSKALGEPSQIGCLTLRTSIIGRELQRTTGLLEWFLSNRNDSVRGFSNAIWSGVTTRALSEVVEGLIALHPWSDGLFHVASEPVSKYDLLSRINRALDLGIDIDPIPEPVEDRSLCTSKFRSQFGISVPDMDDMINSLSDDLYKYDEWRGWNVSF